LNSIAVVIINHNTCQNLRECLATVEGEHASEVVVVDNASTDNSVEIVKNEFPETRLFSNKSNSGYGSAANQAITRCNAPYVLLLNSDTCLHPGSLRALCAYLDEHPKAAIVGPRLINTDGSLQPSCYSFPTPFQVFLEETTLNRFIGHIPVIADNHLRTWSHTSSRIVPWVLGAALAIRRQSFDAVGGFDTSFFMFAEEIDLCYRLLTAGWQTHFTPAATITHAGGASTRQYRAEMAVRFFQSMAHFYRLHYSRADYVQFMGVMKAIVLARLARDTVRLHLTTREDKKTWIAEGVKAWRRILWNQAGDYEKVK